MRVHAWCAKRRRRSSVLCELLVFGRTYLRAVTNRLEHHLLSRHLDCEVSGRAMSPSRRSARTHPMSALGSMDEDEWSLRQRRKTEILAGVPTNDLLERAKAQLAQAGAEEAHEKEVRTARELVRMRDETEAAHEILSKLECTRARLAREGRPGAGRPTAWRRPRSRCRARKGMTQLGVLTEKRCSPVTARRAVSMRARSALSLSHIS